MNFLRHYLPPILEWLRTNNAVLFASTAGVCLCAGISLFLIWHRTLREQWWLAFFSVAYLLWAMQYFFRWAASSQLTPLFWSTLNNYFLTISALLLLRWIQKQALFRSFLVTLLLGLTLTSSILWKGGPWERVPDSVTSVTSLWLLGRGLTGAIPLGSSRSRMRWLSQSTAVLYVLTQLLYLLSPMLARHLPAKAGTTPEPAFTAASPDLRAPHTEDRPASGPATSAPEQLTTRERNVAGLDLFAFAAALPLKLLVYLVALYIVSRSIERLHPRGGRSAGRQGRTRPPASISELAEHFGQVLDASLCEICVRLPGQRHPQVLWGTAVDGTALPQETGPRPDAPGSYVARVLASGQSEHTALIPERSARYLERHPGLRKRRSILTVPIGLPSASSESMDGWADRGSSASRRPTIGALSIEWFEPVPLNETMELQVQQMADQIAPYLEKERELAAIESLSRRIGRLESETTAPLNARALVARIVDSVHDLFAPNRTELQLTCGFDELRPIIGASADPSTLPASEHPPESRDNPSDCRLSARLQLHGAQGRATHSAVGWAENIGTFTIVVPPARGPINDVERPILGTTKFYRDLTASMLVDAALDVFRRSLAEELARIAAALTDPAVQTPEEAWKALNAAITQGSLCWAAVQRDLDSPWLCPSDFADRLRGLFLPATWRNIDVFSPLQPLAMYAGRPARSVVRLPLPGLPNGCLWLGLPRRDFGPELADPPSPWRTFLEGIATVAGTKFARIRSREQIDHLTREAMVAQSVVVGSTLLHEVMAHATAVVNGLKALDVGVRNGEVHMAEDHLRLLRSILDAAADLGAVLDSLQQARSYDIERPTSLARALEIVERLHHFRLARQAFRLTLDLPANLPQVDVPLHVLTLVLSNLVGNSLDANQTAPGNIWVRAEASEDYVICEVEDDGPGLPAGRPVFAAGRSTKKGGTGLGLWLSKRSLNDVGGQIVADAGKPGARFTIHLPGAR